MFHCFCILRCTFILKHSEKTQIRSHAHSDANESPHRISFTSVYTVESIALNYSLSGGGNKVVNPPHPAAPNTTLCLCSSVPRLRIMFSSAGAFSDDQCSTQAKRRMYTVSTSQQTESITQQPLAGISWLSYNILNCKRDYMAGQFMVHCILQLKSTFKSEMYIHPGLVPLFSVLFCLFVCLFFFFCTLCASHSFQYAVKKKKWPGGKYAT